MPPCLYNQTILTCAVLLERAPGQLFGFFLPIAAAFWLQPVRWIQQRVRGEPSADEDLSADGAIAHRIRAELAALTRLPDERFVVASTGSTRGLGLFVADQAISSGTYLFDYVGRLLEQEEHDVRYAPGARGDYVVGITRADGSRVYVDGAKIEESNIARYMNHADPASANCCCWTLADPAVRVMLFAASDLEAGEELWCACWGLNEPGTCIAPRRRSPFTNPAFEPLCGQLGLRGGILGGEAGREAAVRRRATREPATEIDRDSESPPSHGEV